MMLFDAFIPLKTSKDFKEIICCYPAIIKSIFYTSELCRLDELYFIFDFYKCFSCDFYPV